MTDLVCSDHRRRTAARAAGTNGLDYIEVSDDQCTLTVFFLGKAPDRISRGNVRITGPPAARIVEVDGDPDVHRYPEPDVDDCMEIRVAAPGDFSTYTLCLVEPDDRGHPTDKPMTGFDPQLACLKFSFAVVCPSELDCATDCRCAEPARAEPEIDYQAKDYASFRQLLLDRLSLVMPQWTERRVPDVGIAVVELLAYAGDHLSYLQDAVATEAYLATARQRISVRRHARLVDYAMHDGCNARILICLEPTTDQTIDLAQLQLVAMRETAPDVPAPTPAELARSSFTPHEVFEPIRTTDDSSIRLFTAHEEIDFHSWGDARCCLAKGATSATLVDRWADDQPDPDEEHTQRPRALDLQPGDLLILEEVRGPGTGDPADADRGHRHPVRLTAVEAAVDPLGPEPDGQPVVNITWDDADALPFALCLSALREGDCTLLEGISIARGNVILADHGRTVDQEPLGEVELAEATQCCEDERRPADPASTPAVFTLPALLHSPVTWNEPVNRNLVPAARLLAQEPRRCLPQVALTQRGHLVPGDGWTWSPRQDLLGSGPHDRTFVVETDDAGSSHLRFGDGRHGRQPEAQTRFSADYRVGNGPQGNVGADATWRIVFRDSPDGTGGSRGLSARNPLPASGGVAPESVDDVKALAPQSFRTLLERAVTPDDYAMIAAREDIAGGQVQRAAASLRWTGSWYEVLTTVDARGERTADPALLKHVAGGLHRYRRIGHDLVMAPAEYVALLVELTVCVLPGYLRGHVEAALRDRFSNRLLLSGRLGYFHPDNLTFGAGVTVSGLIAATQHIAGVESVQVTRLERLPLGPRGEVEAGILPLGPDEVARLDNDPNAPDHGVLRLNMGGGR